MTRTILVEGDPVPKPRMTKADKWKQRPCVVRYRAWADLVRACSGRTTKLPMPAGGVMLRVEAFFGMPEAWGSREREVMTGKPHLLDPDGDNLLKAVQDALWQEDNRVWDAHVTKRWDDGKGARTIITITT
ncbi:RusA family crossover junction endodeoxyribonuclease [Candidatus Nitrospira bockiana]